MSRPVFKIRIPRLRLRDCESYQNGSHPIERFQKDFMKIAIRRFNTVLPYKLRRRHLSSGDGADLCTDNMTVSLGVFVLVRLIPQNEEQLSAWFNHRSK